MRRLHLVILLFLTGLVAACAGWFLARQYYNFSGAVLVISGHSQMVLPPLPKGVEYPQEPSPSIVVAECGVGKFKITKATENGEYAKIRIGDLTTGQLQCLLEKGQQSIEGDAPERPFGPPPRRSYSPLYLSLETEL